MRRFLESFAVALSVGALAAGCGTIETGEEETLVGADVLTEDGVDGTAKASDMVTGAIAWEHADYSGAYLRIRYVFRWVEWGYGGVADAIYLNYVGDDWNDRISSMQNYNYVHETEWYQHPNLQGESVNIRWRWNYRWAEGLNDRISSVKLWQGHSPGECCGSIEMPYRCPSDKCQVWCPEDDGPCWLYWDGRWHQTN